MKKINLYTSLIFLFTFLCVSLLKAQSPNEIKFNISANTKNNNKNKISISALVDSKQSGEKGINFELILRNYSSSAILIKNIAEELTVALYNENGLDLAIPNEAGFQINRRRSEVNWKLRSQSVIPGSVYINGEKQRYNIKAQEYINIPAYGTLKINLTIKSIKLVKSKDEMLQKSLKPSIDLLTGKYKLKMWLLASSKDQTETTGYIVGFESPIIDIEYTK
ncbi:hypothetical protein [Pedobacter sp. MW01-1-1]|uniref:hypothetical protein n=1 Tax=Pedobacter sp. MW01-1-1 TaxID=3383027 RepID=UPI003FEE6C73